MRRHPTRHAMILLGLMILLSGCDKDRRLADLAEEHTRQQAAQNQHMAELQKEIAQGAKQLVEADSRAREGIIALQRDIQTERSEVGHQRDLLEEDRRQIAEQRHRDPIIAATIMQVGMVVACGLPLILCWYLLRREPVQADDTVVVELLLDDLVNESPVLLPRPLPRPSAIACEDAPSDSGRHDIDQLAG
jgi:hypothetical protein